MKKLIPILMILLMLPVSIAWGPTTHMLINDRMIKELPSSSIKETIVNNRQCFDAGFVATDVTIFYYFSTGLREKYESTHSWSFQEECMRLAETDCQRSFCYGVAAHLIQDSVSHNIFVPERIKKYYCPNNPCHPLFELKPEAHTIKTFPETYTRLQHSLNPLLNNPILMNKFQQSVSKLTVIDVEFEVRRFNDVIGNPEGFYSRAFNVPEVYKSFAYGNRTYGAIILLVGFGLGVLGIWRKKRFFLILPILIIILGGFFLGGGIVGFTSNEGFDKYMGIAVDRSIEIFQPAGWNNRYKYDPTGFARLDQATDQIMWVWFLIIGGIIFIIALFIYLKLRRRR